MTPEELTKIKCHMALWDPKLVPVECQGDESMNKISAVRWSRTSHNLRDVLHAGRTDGWSSQTKCLMKTLMIPYALSSSLAEHFSGSIDVSRFPKILLGFQPWNCLGHSNDARKASSRVESPTPLRAAHSKANSRLAIPCTRKTWSGTNRTWCFQRSPGRKLGSGGGLKVSSCSPAGSQVGRTAHLTSSHSVPPSTSRPSAQIHWCAAWPGKHQCIPHAQDHFFANLTWVAFFFTLCISSNYKLILILHNHSRLGRAGSLASKSNSDARHNFLAMLGPNSTKNQDAFFPHLQLVATIPRSCSYLLAK